MAYISPTPYTPGKLITAASTNATSVTTVATVVGYLSMGNLASTPIFVKVYDKASSPTVGTDVPKHTFVVPGNLSGSGSNVTVNGLKLSSGFAIAVTNALADTDTAVLPAAGTAVINFGTANA